MKDLVYVTIIRPREPEYKGEGFTMYVPCNDFEALTWYSEHYKPNQFKLPSLNSPAHQLLYELGKAVKERDTEQIQELLTRINKYRLPNDDELDENQIWNKRAMQMPADWGPIREKKLKLKRILTNEATGEVLEAMCGFNSYIGESDYIKSVTALDFSRTALEKYEHPERVRILYDLERVIKGERMSFFKNSCFDTICITFGADYLTQPLIVYKEFRRLLKKEGAVLIVGGTAQGYSDLQKHGKFKPEKTKQDLETAGLTAEIIHLKELKKETEYGDYYLVKGVKKDLNTKIK